MHLPWTTLTRVHAAEALVCYLQTIATQRRGLAESELQEAVVDCSGRPHFDLARALLLHSYIPQKLEAFA